MTEAEMKEMLLDIINNGAEYEYKHPETHCIQSETKGCNNCGKCWSKYKLGYEIHLDWKYRKVEKWYVVENPYGFSIERDSKFETDPCREFEGSKEACEKWVEEHTKKTWLEEYIEDNATLEDRAMAYMMSKDICKKILEEVDHQVEVSSETTEGFVIGKNQLRDIIIDLGVEV